LRAGELFVSDYVHISCKYNRICWTNIALKGRINIQYTDTMHKSMLYISKTTQLKQKINHTDN